MWKPKKTAVRSEHPGQNKNKQGRTAGQKKKGRKFPWRGFFSFLMVFFLTLTTLVLFTIIWVKQTWSELSLEEIFFQLTMPLEGTGGGMIGDFILNAVVPTAIILVFWLCLLWLFRKLRTKAFAITSSCISVTALIILGISVTYFWFDIGCDDYFSGNSSDNDFIGEKYVDPTTVNITFPEKKRNLLYIYLESMEITYADDASGGDFGDDNVIPELTALAQENEDFSGSEDTLNGGYAMPGATWTIGAMFAQTSGLPLKISIDGNDMSSESSFFPGITTLGDILQEQGYSNELLIGSDASFGGRKLYFSKHGNYSIFDYKYAVNQGLIPSDYYVWWGFEDAKLFEYAKSELTRLSASDQPYNLTMLTVDTHFEDGYVCDLCGDEFGDNQYANVMACSSRQVAAFIQWVQTQDFYDDLTIVISGDHPTMDADFCEDTDKSIYQRQVYTTYINADAEVADPDKRREYTTFDDFPTTLAALGCDIEGERLGLGTNLFSSTDTLSETYGTSTLDSNLSKKSAFMNNLSGLDNSKTDIREYSPTGNFKATLDDDGNLTVTADKIDNDDGSTESAYLLISSEDKKLLKAAEEAAEADTEQNQDGTDAEGQDLDADQTDGNTDTANTGDEAGTGDETITAEGQAAEEAVTEDPLNKTFPMTRNDDGSYSVTISPADLESLGSKYLVHCYLVNSEGYEFEIGNQEFPDE